LSVVRHFILFFLSLSLSLVPENKTSNILSCVGRDELIFGSKKSSFIEEGCVRARAREGKAEGPASTDVQTAKSFALLLILIFILDAVTISLSVLQFSKSMDRNTLGGREIESDREPASN